MILRFDNFRLDPTNLRLEDGAGPVRLTPKAFDVLRALVERRGELVSKDQLLDEVWPETHVTDGVLKVCVVEIRKVLGDSAAAPRFIETVHRRGYRFVAPVVVEGSADDGSGREAGVRASTLVVWPPGRAQHDGASVGLVGRGDEVALLGERLAQAIAGQRQMVFLAGEPGAGKTALVEDFLAGAAEHETLAITGGQCLEQLGVAEAYMPVLEAVGRLVREGGSPRALLRRCAPTWFAQLPWLVEKDDRDQLERELLGGARERMLRELGEFVEALGREVPLVLVLEDLHWCDPSTMDLLAFLAARREPARLLVLATYRPVALVLTDHPLRGLVRRLATSAACTEIVLDVLDIAAVGDYLVRRFVGGRFPPEVARLLCARSGGNPLFLVTLVDRLVARGVIHQSERGWEAVEALRDELGTVPESLRRWIEQQLEPLGPEDRVVLEGGSLAGLEFSTAAAAAGAARAIADVEERCERLGSTGSFLVPMGVVQFPDGTTATRYAFRHALYCETLVAGIPARRKAEAHLRIGDTLEHTFGTRSSDLGAELALHFEEGGAAVRAARYRGLAAEKAASLYAFAEAEIHLERGLALLAGLPASPERDHEEKLLQSALGAVRRATRGYATTEVEHAYARALEIASGAGDESAAFLELWGVWGLHFTRGELDRALELCGRIEAIAAASGDRLPRLQAHHARWMTHFFRGELAAAFRHVEAGEPLYSADDRAAALVYAHDAKASALSYRALLLWSFGRIDESLDADRRAIAEARALGHPMSLAFVLVNAGWLRLLRREPAACAELAEAVIAYSTEQQVPFWLGHGLLLRGWASAEQGELAGGVADIEQGLAAMDAIESGLGRTAHYANLAVAKARAGDFAAARELMERSKALVASTGERYHEPEIHRLDAELMLAAVGPIDRAPPAARAEVVTALERAIDCARRQGARTLQLRATTTLVRVHASGSDATEARTRLAGLLSSFTEGADTADVREARGLIAT